MKPATASRPIRVEPASEESNPPEAGRWLDRRQVIRGAGAVFLVSSLAGCYHEGDDDGGGNDGNDEGDGGGGYGIDEPPAPEASGSTDS